MRKNLIMPAFGRFFLLLCLLWVASCADFRHAPYRDNLPALRDLESVQHELQAADVASANLLLTEIGRVRHAGFDAPVWRLAYRPFQSGRKRALLLSGIHGDDVAGVFSVLKLADALATWPGAAARWDLDVLPIVNPWGWVHGVADNPKGVDVDRDFAAFASSEARIIRRFLREKYFDLVVDLRESQDATGFSIWQYGTTDDTVAEKIISRLQASGYAIEQRSSAYFLKPNDGIVDTPMWGLKLMRLFRQVTIAGYIRQNASQTVYTVQTPAVVPVSDRIAMQQIAMETLFLEYGGQTK